MKYIVKAYSESSDEVCEMYESNAYSHAKGWLVGYLRDGMGGWDQFCIFNSDDEPCAMFEKEYGWTHY